MQNRKRQEVINMIPNYWLALGAGRDKECGWLGWEATSKALLVWIESDRLSTW